MCCFVCSGVWHPATGGYLVPAGQRLTPKSRKICGPCERKRIKYFKGLLSRKTRVNPRGESPAIRESFYEHARPMPEGKDPFGGVPPLGSDDKEEES